MKWDCLHCTIASSQVHLTFQGHNLSIRLPIPKLSDSDCKEILLSSIPLTIIVVFKAFKEIYSDKFLHRLWNKNAQDDGKILGYRWESDMVLYKRSNVFSSVDQLSDKGRKCNVELNFILWVVYYVQWNP